MTGLGWWEKHFLVAELVLSAVAGLALCLWLGWWGGHEPFALLMDGSRGVLYGTLASIFASLLGFVIAAIAIVLPATSDKRLAILRGTGHDKTLFDVFFAATRGLGLATVLALGALVFDRDGSPSYVLASLVVFTVVLVLLRISRVVWALGQVVAVLTRDP